MPSVKLKVLEQLRRFGPIYRLLRSLWQLTQRLTWGTLRLLAPRNPRIGPSKGTFSALELLEQGKVEGRLVEPAHPSPNTEPTSLRRLMGVHQIELGSW